MEINTSFNFYSDSNGRDPDSASPMLRSYHKKLWSKPLPNGGEFRLHESKSGAYLYHLSKFGEFYLGSDAITHSYRNHKRKQWLIKKIPQDVNELFNKGSTIGGYIIFPNKRVDNKHTINQARGVNSLVDDRFDLTLECIRLFYLNEESPLYETLLRYRNFFDLFGDFCGYIDFFFLNDLVDETNSVNFYTAFDGFETKPNFSTIDDYLEYKNSVIQFINARNERIALWQHKVKT